MIEKLAKILFDELDVPCLLADLTHDNIIYINPALQDLLSPLYPDGNIIGLYYYDVIKDENKSCSLAHSKIGWENNEEIEHFVYDKTLHMHFRVNHARIHIAGHDYNFSKYFNLSLEENSSDHFTFEEAMTRCIAICQQAKETIPLDLMKLLCEFYHCKRAYIYHIDRTNQAIQLDVEFGDIPVTKELGQKMEISTLLKWFDSRNEVGIVEANPHFQSYQDDAIAQQVVNSFHVENITVSVVENSEQEVTGIVGLSDREDRFFDYRLINAVARFVASDVNKLVMDSEIKQLHHSDSLTGCFSREVYNSYVEKLQKESPKNIAVIYVNINGLKAMNEAIGFAKGDNHIKQSAEKLKKYFQIPFYRLSGDEFLGISSNCTKDEFEQLVFTHQEEMKSAQDYSYALGHSFGTGNYQFVQLVKEAENICYINKQEYYHNSKRHYDNISNATLSDLLFFLENKEFMIYLQPQVHLKDGTLYGAEALIRRFDKINEKMVFPDQFIPLYEKTSVIRHIDIFVLEEVCRLLQSWHEAGKNMIPISVNLSRVTLQEFGIVDVIASICDKFQVPRAYVVIEVTERVGLVENNVASSLIQDFIHHGFKISLDDFGCAYSNIITLAQIEVDEVKLDKSLVDDLLTSRKNQVLVRNVLNMCHELENTSTLAEGIETENQGNMLKEMGCHLGQGYFYSRPIPVPEFCKKYIS